MRSLALPAALLALSSWSCEDHASNVADANLAAAAATDAAPPPKPAWDAASMPPRPVPKTSPTVGSGMPAEVQMQAIAYMNAMSEPHPDDRPVDTAYVKSTVDQLKSAALAMDKGGAADKTKLNDVQYSQGGRKIDALLAQGCEAETPRRLVQRAGISLEDLLIHGVLVVRCNDSRAQCLQSTRDSDDVLCTTAPRHK